MDKNKLMVFNENIDYMFHVNIVEYDMVSASVSVCDRYRLLPKEKIEWLRLLPKEKRTREMGMLQKDSEFSNKMLGCLIESRDMFIKENNISDDDIISLHSDALFFVKRHKIKDNVNGIPYKMKNQYCSYLKYDKRIEMFFTGDYIDYKQIPLDLIQQHTLGINKILINIFNKIENYDDEVIEYLSKVNSKYLQDKLPEYYYNSFGKVGKYKVENLQLFAFLANVILKEVSSWR